MRLCGWRWWLFSLLRAWASSKRLSCKDQDDDRLSTNNVHCAWLCTCLHRLRTRMKTRCSANIFGERWGKGSKTRVLKYVVYSLSLFLNQFSFFHFPLPVFVFPDFYVLFIPKTKSIEIVLLFVFLTIFEKNNSPKMFSHFFYSIKTIFKKNPLFSMFFKKNLFLHFSIVRKKIFRFHF